MPEVGGHDVTKEYKWGIEPGQKTLGKFPQGSGYRAKIWKGEGELSRSKESKENSKWWY